MRSGGVVIGPPIAANCMKGRMRSLVGQGIRPALASVCVRIELRPVVMKQELNAECYEALEQTWLGCLPSPR